MKTLRILFMLFCLSNVFAGHASPAAKSPLTIKWTMSGNVKEGNTSYYQVTFCVINESKETLGKDWNVYFCQIPSTATPVGEQPLKVETVKASYLRLCPSSSYRAIAPGDSLVAQFHFSGAMIRMSNGPEGAFLVRCDANGRELKPVSVPIIATPFASEAQWSRPGRQELPYPSGELVYKANEPFTQHPALSATDIFPSLKNVLLTRGKCVFAKSVTIECAPALKSLGGYLKARLLSNFQCNVVPKSAATKVCLLLQPTKELDEHYSMSFKNNTVTITGASQNALFDGIQSLLAILGNEKLPCSLSNMEISDYPDLKYRGFMLDVARNFTKKDDILKLIDLLASYKLNVLHLHIGDDEGWRLEIPGLEELTEVGSHRGYTKDEQTCLYPAYSGGWDANDMNVSANGFYSRADFIEILRYAKSRFITVIPEFDTPGHSRAAIKSMEARYNKYIKTNPLKAKEYLLTDFNDKSQFVTAQDYNDNVLNVALPSTYTFIAKVIGEVEKMYKDAGVPFRWFHLGGDEVPHGAWEGSDICQEFMKTKGFNSTHEMKDYFIAQAIEMLKAKGIGLGAWQEVLMTNGKVNEDFKDQKILSYCWDTNGAGEEVPYKLANAGYPVVLSNVANLYFDLAYCKHPQERGLDWGGFVSQEESFNTLPLNVYASVRRNLNGQALNMDSVAIGRTTLNADKKDNIVGIQGQLWGETIRNYKMVEYYILPKMYGLIERAWNAHPVWENALTGKAYQEDLVKYNEKITRHELPRLRRENINFRLSQPGLKIAGKMLYANTSVPGAVIRYTIDGSEPTATSKVWTAPVACSASLVKAKAFYLGKESVTTQLSEK